MALWTDIIDPATLTGYARTALADYEREKGTLAVFLPNRLVADVVARFVKGSTGLIDIAKFRAYDAEPEIGKRPTGKRVTLELPALGQDIPVSEYEQLRARGGTPSDEEILNTILGTTKVVVRAVSDALERMRGIVLETGVATINQSNFQTADDFGRSAGNTVTAATLFSVSTADAIGQIQGWTDSYINANGTAPGAILTSRRVARSIAKLDQFKSALIGGAVRPASLSMVNDTLQEEGLPPIIMYDRNVSVDGVTTKVMSDNKLALLPAPVATDAWEDTELGATFVGRTLTSMEPGWDIAADDQPGIVTGVYRAEKPPMTAEVISDAIGLPVLANADLSFVASVL